MSQERGAKSHWVREEGGQGRVINLGKGGVGRGKDGGGSNGINSLLLLDLTFVLYNSPLLTWVMFAAVTAATRVENLSSATSVASRVWDPEGDTVTGGRREEGRLVTYTGGVRGGRGL